MLQITIRAPEQWDVANNQFVEPKEWILQLEHSLMSLSKWESKWNKAFFSKREKTHDEIIDYIKCMTLNRNVETEAYMFLTNSNIEEIIQYIEAPMTATVFREDKKGKGSNETVTAELIYYWMIALNIPFECQKWHINRLLTLIRVCEIKNSPPKKMSKREIMSRNAALNAARRKKLNSKG